jgi:hypothetical protein
VPVTDTASGTTSADVHRGFSRSILVSAIRCTLTYLVLPFVTPFIGLAPRVGPLVGLPLGLVAMASNSLSIRRFWRADHRWKKPVTVLHCAVIGMLVVLLYHDLAELLG